tara:strand:- start:34496 stop:35569 length:1074 start_codon:yes stop_codon:yes gene_type:complete
MRYKKLLIYTLIFILQIIGVKSLVHYPEFVEKYYSNGIYPVISKAFRFVLGWIPFSFGDIMYAVLIIFLIYSIIKLIRKRFKNSLKFLTEALLIANIVYLSFHVLWGFNYYRQPLHKVLKIDNDYTTEQLISLTQRLIKRSNELHALLEPVDSNAVVFNQSISTIFNESVNGYNQVEESFPKLDYPPKSTKNSLFRYPLSVMGFSGYLNPITNEAQINGLIPPHRWPLVTCHEQGHQLGFAKENEANFIGIIATTSNPDNYFKYSGYIFALRYCLSEVYMRNPQAGELLRDKIKIGILKNYAQSYEFWSSYTNPLEPYLEAFYSNFLKVNNQPAGMQSYNYVVALVVNYFKVRTTLP